MYDNYADVLESYLIAEEGFGMELLKVIGNGIGKIAKSVGIVFGLSVVLGSTLILGQNIRTDRFNKRYANPTPEEKLSRDNFNNTWFPEIKKFAEFVNKDIVSINKKTDISKFLYPQRDHSAEFLSTHGYCYWLCEMDFSTLQYPDADGDDEGDPEKVKEFIDKLSVVKPYFDKWKSAAKKFSPYFELVIYVDDENADDGYADFSVCLRCKWLDKDNILKPGLPEFK